MTPERRSPSKLDTGGKARFRTFDTTWAASVCVSVRLIEATALSKLDPTLTFFNGPNAVTISWGGALVGHWGLIIQTDGKSEGGDIARDITTFVSSE